MKCRELWLKGADTGYYKCLGDYSQKFDDKVKGYFLSAIASGSPAELALPQDGGMNCLIIRMLREFELGGRAAAMASLGQAYARYEAECNMLRGEPYKRDKELALLIKQDSDSFWDGRVYDILMMWPPEKMAKILSELKKHIALTRRLKLLECVLEDAGARDVSGERPLRKRITSDIFGIPYGDAELLRKKEAGQAKKLNDSAVEKMRLGDFKAAKILLLKAADMNEAAPEVYMNLCSLWIRENNKEQALKACQSAVQAVYAFPENQTPGLRILAGEAAFKSYRLLYSLGRKAAALEVLKDCVQRAPPDWDGAVAARAELKGFEH